MTVTAQRTPLWSLYPIGLAELIECASLQTRMDRKYVLPAEEISGLLTAVGRHARVLEIEGARSFGYESVYFDTPELTSYLLTARRRRRRFKIRTRTYVDSAQCWLEVKTRSARGHTVKNRLPYELGDHATLAPGRAFVDGVLTGESVAGCQDMVFAPTLITNYQRSTFFLPATESRFTIDTDLVWQDNKQHRLAVPGLAVVETKTGSTASRVDRLLWDRGFRPTQISKYATGLAALQPDLPATPWRRTLRRYFTPPAHPAGWPLSY